MSEDPFLNGGYAAQFVAGFQGSGDGVGYTKAAACCKHFYAYSLEGSDGFTRHNFNAVVSQRDLHETFLPSFKTCVAAQPEQIMCSCECDRSSSRPTVLFLLSWEHHRVCVS